MAAKLPTPASFIRQQMKSRGMTQADLAFVLGVPVPAISYLATGRRGISADMAAALAAVFEVTPEYILEMQKASEVKAELARARQPDPGIGRKAKLVSTYPMRDMIKRGWIDPDEDIETQVASFFGVAAIDEVPHLEHAGKKSSYTDIPPPQLAWLFRVRQIAREMVVSKYSESALRATLPRLQALMTAPEEARQVPRLLAECGVRFVLVQSLPSAKIDGVCFWIDGSPVVGMSLRFDRIDNFWFVLGHELEHVLRGHGRVTPVIDDLEGERGGDGNGLPEEERQANAAGSEFCVPKAQLDSWIARKAPFFAERDLIGFAKRLQIHPGIAAGQLRNRTSNYKIFSRHLVKVSPSLVPSAAFVDGWGQVAPVMLEERNVSDR